jgi:hypothetical protein
MSQVAITTNSQLAEFRVRAHASSVGPAVEVLLSAPRYKTRARLAAGYATGKATVPIVPPSRDVVGEACFVNRGPATALLDGTTEPRAVSRSALRLEGRPVAGDIALEFLDNRRLSLLDRAAQVFDRASNLTDHLVPAWLIWILALLVALGVPSGTLAAFYLALREDDARPS